LVKVKVADTCMGFDKSDNMLALHHKFKAVSSGICRLETPTFDMDYNPSTNDGKALFTARLFKLTFTGYVKKKDWDKENIYLWQLNEKAILAFIRYQ
jgi:hypothetical protein